MVERPHYFSKLIMAPKNIRKIPVKTEKAQRCVTWLTVSLGIGLIYALSLVFSISLGLAMPDMTLPPIITNIILLIWALAKIGFAFSLVCLYQTTGYSKWALAALLLAASALMPFVLKNPESQFLVIGVEALAVTALSLSLFDLGRATHTALETPAGFIFIGIILQILQNQLMAYVGIVFLAIGFYLSLKRLWQQTIASS